MRLDIEPQQTEEEEVIWIALSPILLITGVGWFLNARTMCRATVADLHYDIYTPITCYYALNIH